jgi:hypothetical protein
MGMTQIAILLEILGFIVASVFAGILLERGAVGSLADKVNNWIKLTANTLDKDFPLPPPKALTTAAWYSMWSILLGVAVVLTVIGWLNKNFWALFLKYTPLLTVPEVVDLFKKAASLGFRPPGK